MTDWTARQVEDAFSGDLVPVLTASVLDAYKAPVAPLTAHDRCDSCGAETLYRVHRPPTADDPHRKGVLEFCGHHYNKFEPTLTVTGWQVAVRHPRLENKT